MRRGNLLLLVAALGGCFLGNFQSSAKATALFVFNPFPPANENDGSGSFNIGNQFKVGASALDVTAIGAYVGNDQAAGVTTVTFLASLYDGSNTRVTSQIVPIGTAVDAQGFAYVPYVTSLAANTTYAVTDIATDPTGTTSAPNTPFAYAAPGASAGSFSGATFVQNVYINSPGTPNAAPTLTNPGYQEFLGGNLQVPEPAAISVVGMGALGLLARRRRA